MFIHIGNKNIISDKKYIGIFNLETLKLSEINDWIIKLVDNDDKSIAIDEKNNIVSSKVSPFTVIKRTTLDKDFIWRKGNE